MNLKDLKLDAIDTLSQIIIFDLDGKVLDSDDRLVSVRGASNNIFEDTMFAGMAEEFQALNLGEQITFDCIHTEFFGRLSHYDFVIQKIDSKGQFSLVAYDFKKQYQKVFELQQERNLAEMHNKKLERKTNQLVHQKDTIEKLYTELQHGGSEEYVLIKEDNILVNIELKDIIFVEAFGDYIKVHTANRIYVTHSTMRAVEEKLPKERFFRIHRSYIIALDKITNIEQTSLLLGEKILPIGKAFKTPLLKKIKQI